MVFETLSQQVCKADTQGTYKEIKRNFFRIKFFGHKCVIYHLFLNQVELAARCSFIGLKDDGFNPQCIYNKKYSFSETVPPKIMFKYV